MRALGFIGSSRRKAATQALPPVVDAWREQWCFSHGAKPWVIECVEQVEASDQAHMTSLAWLKAEIAGSAVYLAGDWKALVFGPFAQELPAGKTADHLLEEARHALINGLLASMGQPLTSGWVAAAPRMLGQPMSAEILLRISAEPSMAYVVLDASLLNGVLGPQQTKPPLFARENALGSARVTLSLQFPLASLSIGEMNGLQPGDTLRAQALLSQALHLRVGPRVVAAGYLARQRDHLAVQLISGQ